MNSICSILIAVICVLTLVGAAYQATDVIADGTHSTEKDLLVSADQTRGLIKNTAKSSPGYVFFSPLFSDKTYLINKDGQVVHIWQSEYSPSGGLYLLENGNLLRGAREPEVPRFGAGGQAGRLQEISWDGQIVWDYVLATEERLLHHDVAVMPNGNILAICYEYISPERCRKLGRRPDLIPEEGLWTDMIVELEPKYPGEAEIFWEWHMIDHIIQNIDPDLPNYGDPAKHPEKMDINQVYHLPKTTADELKKQREINRAPPNTTIGNRGSDLMHSNAIDYNPHLDQIVISIHHYNEIWILDHSVSWREASSGTGGKSGRGGDILYRWGNPKMYGMEDADDQKLFGQHDAKWIAPGLPGADNLMVFNNRRPWGEKKYSSVYELSLPVNIQGHYSRTVAGVYGPEEPLWSYTAPDTSSFFASFISGAQRIANGHTLVTSGPQGRFFEVTPEGEIVWEYWTPYSGDVRLPDGSTPQPVGENIFATFRATFIANDHPIVAGKDLKPLSPQPKIFQE